MLEGNPILRWKFDPSEWRDKRQRYREARPEAVYRVRGRLRFEGRCLAQDGPNGARTTEKRGPCPYVCVCSIIKLWSNVGPISSQVDLYCPLLPQLLGMIHWALIASTFFVHAPAYGWVMFVAVTLWLLTTILFSLILFSCHTHLSFVPWPLTVGKKRSRSDSFAEITPTTQGPRAGISACFRNSLWLLLFQLMMYNGIAAVLYLTAFLTNAANVPTGFIYGGHLGAAAVRSFFLFCIFSMPCERNSATVGAAPIFTKLRGCVQTQTWLKRDDVRPVDGWNCSYYPFHRPKPCLSFVNIAQKGAQI